VDVCCTNIVVFLSVVGGKAVLGIVPPYK